MPDQLLHRHLCGAVKIEGAAAASVLGNPAEGCEAGVDHILQLTKINADALRLRFSKDFLALRCSNRYSQPSRPLLYSLQITNFRPY
ncbi:MULTISPECIES: hypothetical protein [Mesorhizobium]|uniref:hypothetical protein n=1 Tax=Mesorhizobium TaxID=68287 RepID=UPI0010A97086|nr:MULTISPECIES: hypothetical protein [Mesorhizobium]